MCFDRCLKDVLGEYGPERDVATSSKRISRSVTHFQLGPSPRRLSWAASLFGPAALIHPQTVTRTIFPNLAWRKYTISTAPIRKHKTSHRIPNCVRARWSFKRKKPYLLDMNISREWMEWNNIPRFRGIRHARLQFPYILKRKGFLRIFFYITTSDTGSYIQAPQSTATLQDSQHTPFLLLFENQLTVKACFTL